MMKSRHMPKPKRIRFWHDGHYWYARASLKGFVPVGRGETPEDALIELSRRIQTLRLQLERGDPAALLWEGAWKRGKRDAFDLPPESSL
jgi:hypothetical protein